MKKYFLIIEFILIAFIFGCCKALNDDTKEEIASSDYISDVTYKIIDYDQYILNGLEKQIYESDYEELLYWKKAILVIEFKTSGNPLDLVNDMYTIKITYKNMSLELLDSSTSYSSNENNTLRLDYTYINTNEIKTERLELVIEPLENASLNATYGDTKILSIYLGEGTLQYSVTLYTDIENGIYSIIKVAESSNYSLTNPYKDGYEFTGWYLDKEYTEKVDGSITITNDVILYAKWVIKRIDLDNLTSRFGSYPQTKVSDESVITELNTKAGTLPTEENLFNWHDYGYYISSNIESYMYYIDIDLNDDGLNDYRGVYFTSYRPYGCNESSIIDKSYQDENGYNLNTVYWFKYEPIVWDIVSIEDNKYTLVSRYLIDSQQFDFAETYSSNYQESTIRTWLNETFYDLAFTLEEKELIQTTLVDNSLASTGYDTNTYVCDNTFDKVFLLSVGEVKTYYANFSDRIASGTDYAKSQGLKVYSNYVDKSDNKSSYWLLRSPDSDVSFIARGVNDSGYFTPNSLVFSTYIGIRVSIVIKN